MDFEFSQVGRKLTAESGIVSLMDDLGRAVTVEPDMLMLGGGNPAAVPVMQARWRERMSEMISEGESFDRMLGNYDPPQGNPHFVRALAEMLQREFGWNVEPDNIAVTLGGQTAFFLLFNLLAGNFGGGRRKRVLLPLCPEYMGYADQGLDDDLFLSCRPTIEWPEGRDARIFKYRVDFDAVESALRGGDIAALAVSRPTNPTGNVLTDTEIRRLSDLGEAFGVPLIIDNAYGAPFPNVIFTPTTPFWTPNAILTLSLSKLGLPGTRTGFVIAPPRIARAVASMTAVLGLANTNIGQRLVQPLIESGELLQLSRNVVRPFYEERSHSALAALHQAIGDRFHYAVHASEGAFFHWLWLPGLPISTRELYVRLKARKVLVVTGDYFFFGLEGDWPHSLECLRLNFSGSPAVVHEGLQRIADVVAGL